MKISISVPLYIMMAIIFILTFQPIYGISMVESHAYSAFIKEGKVWEYKGYFPMENHGDGLSVNFQITMEGDSIVDGIVWKKCWYCADGENILPLPLAMVREESHKIYLLPNIDADTVSADDEYYQRLRNEHMMFSYWEEDENPSFEATYPLLLFDYDLEEGEGLSWPWYGFSREPEYDELNDEYHWLFEIESIDYKTYCGTEHKVLKDNGWREFADGLGAFQGTFLNPVPCYNMLTSPQPGQRRSWFDAPRVSLTKVRDADGTVLYDSNELSGIAENNVDASLTISFDGETINVANISPVTLRIYTLSGRCIKSLSDDRQTSIKVGDFIPGIYVAVAENESLPVAHLKFMVK